ncbi:MAG: porphobilinogen synthase [Rhodobacteraceae bacterium]|nr:porphobilinogen synthase [Paracoccaceae bacterium]
MTNTKFPQFPEFRPRRLRQNKNIRDLVHESSLNASDLIWPLFICEGKGVKDPITMMPGVFRYSLDVALKEIEAAANLGIKFMALFPCIPNEDKTADCSIAWDPENLANRALKLIKQEIPEVSLILDVALDPYNLHGHDGIVVDDEIVNDLSIDALARQALVHAQCGADILAPSDMMDGRISKIRKTLDANNFSKTMILSYSAKYASAFYEGFRDALGSGQLIIKDKKSYQMDYRNSDEALRMVQRDIHEGADMVMIKPGLVYLDIIQRVKDNFNIPILSYQVSGEYAMIKGAIDSNLLSSDQIIFETLQAFKRAGCCGILTYFAPYVAKSLQG